MQIEDNASYIEAEEFPLWCFFTSSDDSTFLVSKISAPDARPSYFLHQNHLLSILLLFSTIYAATGVGRKTTTRDAIENERAKYFWLWMRVCAGTCFAVWKLRKFENEPFEFQDVQLLAQKLVLLWKYLTSFREIFRVEVEFI